ncbi:flavodoxin family protein [Metasolibacillus sp. FSL H7-0170]|uniref:flavodoxin family protein n=1 Tax=Metasolibacillus TaxID=2703677 RepID=UPI0007955359|nr:flavodoxin family protein [Metasolibacillus fluoroglycofenilyticus]KYG88882.1 NAD(P)H-dependent oxidoreductase [[Bacillus] sp. KCTC 13219]
MKILLLTGSTRNDGNSEELAHLALKDLPYEAIQLKDLHIKPIEDLRHTPEGFHPVDDDYTKVLEAILRSDMLVLATPIYWYSMSGTMKNVIDRFSHAIRDTRYPNVTAHLKTMKAVVIAVGGDQPRIKGLPLIQQCQYTFDFLGIEFYSYLIGEARKPGTISSDLQAIQQAHYLNQQLKQGI